MLTVTAVAGKTPEPPPRPQGLCSMPYARPSALHGLRTRPQGGDPLVQGEPGRGECEGADPGLGVGPHPVRDPLDGAEQGRGVDQRVRDGRRGARLVARQVLVLDLGGFLLVAHALGELVVEVLLPAAHAADVQGRVRAEHVGEGGHVVTDGQRHGRADVEALHGQPGLLAARPDVGERGGLEVLGGGEDEQGAVGDLAGLLQVLRPDGGDVERDVLALRVHGELDRLAGAAGQRQRPVLALVAEALAGHRLADDLHVLPGAGERLVELDAVPALGDLGAGDAEAEPEAALGEGVEGGGRHGGHRGLAGRDLHDRGADVDALGLGGDPGEHGRGVGAVGLRGPADVVAEAVRLLGHGEVVGVHASAPVAEIDAEPHVSSPYRFTDQ